MTETLALDTEFFNSNEKNQFNVAGVICTSTTETLKFDLVNQKHKFIEIIEGYKNKKIILAYAASAEARSMLSLGLNPLEYEWVDLYVEFRMLCNSNHKYQYGKYLDKEGLSRYSTPPPYPALDDEDDTEDHSETPYNLVNAVYKMLDVKLDSIYKDEMRNLILSKDLEKIQEHMDEILEYCASDTRYLRALDVAITNALLKESICDVRKDQLERGRYSVATALCEQIGMPVNVELLNKIIEKTPAILDSHKETVNKFFPFFVPETCKPPKTYKNGNVFHYKPEPAHKDMNAYQIYVSSLNIQNFPKTKTGKYKSDSKTLEEFGYSTYGEGLEELWKFNKTDSSLKWFRGDNGNGFFTRFGSDNNIRPYFGIFGTQTGRNAAKAKTFPLAMSSWLRAIINPEEGEIIVGSDFSQQEVYVAAILSGDQNLLDAYNSGDVYLAFAKMAGMVPESATKSSHKFERNLCKSTVLGLQFGMGSVKLQTKLKFDTKTDVTIERTLELIQAHKNTFSTYWQWVYDLSERYKDGVPLITNDGWVLFPDNPVMTSVRNFPVQGNAASITRRAITLLVEKNLKVMCGLHDAVYVRGAARNERMLIHWVEEAMLQATREILQIPVTTMRIDTKVIHHNEIWMEEKGETDLRKLAPLLGLEIK